ncbi:MAG: hypothetical protein ACPHX6_06085, partial [Cobetia amphilecti]
MRHETTLHETPAHDVSDESQQAKQRPRASRLSPITRRRMAAFRDNRRAWWSLLIFGVLFVLSLGAELIANDRPLLVEYQGETYLPMLHEYPETTFGGFLPTAT